MNRRKFNTALLAASVVAAVPAVAKAAPDNLWANFDPTKQYGHVCVIYMYDGKWDDYQQALRVLGLEMAQQMPPGSNYNISGAVGEYDGQTVCFMTASSFPDLRSDQGPLWLVPDINDFNLNPHPEYGVCPMLGLQST